MPFSTFSNNLYCKYKASKYRDLPTNSKYAYLQIGIVEGETKKTRTPSLKKKVRVERYIF